MTVLKALFTSKVPVPDEPVNLPVNYPLRIFLQPIDAFAESGGPRVNRPLARLVQALKNLGENPDWPTDAAVQHDHYLYGLPKR